MQGPNANVFVSQWNIGFIYVGRYYIILTRNVIKATCHCIIFKKCLCRCGDFRGLHP